MLHFLSAWNRIEATLRESAPANSVNLGPALLASRLGLPTAMRQELDEVRRTRNHVVHGIPTAFDTKHADRAIALERSLKELLGGGAPNG